MLTLAASPAFAQNFNLQLRSTLEYPNQTLANICGYAQNGKEYALVGAAEGLVIVDVTNAANPVNIVQIPGPDNLWKEIKTYSHYAYVTSEGGKGIQIVDLGPLPSPTLNYHYYTGKGQFPNASDSLNRVHALHIDVKKGFLYAYGGGLFNGGAKVFDLKADPYNPTYAGKFDALGYVHDGYADNDTLYAAHINAGILSIVNMSNKANPVLLGTVQTPGKFTHNAWLLDDHKHILTTDEDTPSFVTSYDISDPQDIKELDRCSTNDGNNSIGHNTHVRNDWAITSWYADGVVIIDAHRPQNLVITGWYDTWPATGAIFDGCWGVYPFLPSGTVVASNIPVDQATATGKLFVFTPTYVRACYLEGTVKNGCNGLPLGDVSIDVNSADIWIDTKTQSDGSFKTGQAQPGNFIVTISKQGFVTKTFNVTFAPGEVVELNVTLDAAAAYSITGTVVAAATQAPIANAPVIVSNASATYNLQTNAAGKFNIDCVSGGNYQVYTDSWGFLPGTAVVGANGGVTIALEKGYYDDFAFNLGWATSFSGATAGLWVRGEPVGTTNQGEASNPDFDIPTDASDKCFVTGNGGGSVGSDDVDGGSVTLICPPMQLAGYQDAVLSFWYWFYNSGGSGSPNDQFEVRATSNGQTVTLLTETNSESDWRFSGEIHLKNYVTLTDDVKVQFITADQDPGHLVEAAVDVFKVVPSNPVGVKPEVDASAFVTVTPNPTATSFAIRYDWPAAQHLTLEVRNLLGQVMTTRQLDSNTGSLTCGDAWPKGVYVATLRSDERQSAPLRMVKQ